MGRRAAVAALSAALEKAFPGLRGTHYAVTSPPTPTYNCIAWAAGESNRWWWPTSSYFWPTGIPREETLLAFVGAYATLGYADGSLVARWRTPPGVTIREVGTDHVAGVRRNEDGVESVVVFRLPPG